MNSASKVGQIYSAAGLAFTTLGKLTMQLHSAESANSGSKWSEEDIEMLKESVRRFGEDLEKISEHIKEKTVMQIHGGLKKKAFDAAGVPVPRPTVSSTSPKAGSPPQQTVVVQPTLSSNKSTAEVTLNMLNASETEVDVEGLNFESSTDVVST